jgi:hypothetical protein
METSKKGDWVRIHRVVLTPGQRAVKLPEETRQVPLEMWVTGTLRENEATIGDHVSVTTVTGRVVEGRLVTVHPAYGHSFGAFVPELQAIRGELRDLMEEGGRHDLESKL